MLPTVFALFPPPLLPSSSSLLIFFYLHFLMLTYPFPSEHLVLVMEDSVQVWDLYTPGALRKSSTGKLIFQLYEISRQVSFLSSSPSLPSLSLSFSSISKGHTISAVTVDDSKSWVAVAYDDSAVWVSLAAVIDPFSSLSSPLLSSPPPPRRVVFLFSSSF